MALVAYDYGSESEQSDTEENNDSEVILNPKVVDQIPKIEEPSKVDTPNSENVSSATSSSIFSSLPPTKESKELGQDYDDKIEDFIPKPPKVKQKVRITIPSLSQFDSNDDNEIPAKKPKPSSKGSGLLGLLPPVKSVPLTTKSFVPNSVKNSAQKPTTSKNLVPHSVRKNSEIKKKETLAKKTQKLSKAGSDIESDDDLEIPDTFDDEMWEKVCGRPKPKPEIIISNEEQTEPIELNIAPEPTAPYEGLDNKAFKELVGKTKRPLGNIKLIDINEEEILGEKDLWMTKSLTDPEMAPKASEEDQVDPTRRKKHHITYLAQQAKANEQELQSSWAASKNNRMMSRAKYGF